MAPSRALKKTDSHASEAEAIVDLELVKQASSRVADADAFISGEALYAMAQENLTGFQTMFEQELEEQAALASQVPHLGISMQRVGGRLLCHGSGVPGLQLSPWLARGVFDACLFM